MKTVFTTRPLFVIYDLEHIEAAVAHAKAGGEILAINFWAERALAGRGVAFRSYADYRTSNADEGSLIAKAQIAAREWYRIPEMQFFEHKGIPLGEALESGFVIYLGRLSYYRTIFERILDVNPGAHLIVPYPAAQISAATGPLTHFEMSAAVDAARAATATRNLPFSTIGEAPRSPQRHVHPDSRLHTALVGLYNAVIKFAPRRKMKIYATEYWHHIAPCIERMNDVELVLMERGELRNIPWRQIWKHRVRLVHPRDAASARVRRVAREAVERFRKKWPAARSALAAHEIFALMEWTQVEPVLEYLVCAYAERVVVEIEAFEKLLRHERPDKVLLRVSISSYQTHFFVLARMARRLGIPSVEIQHAGAHVDPRSVYSRLETDYLASYGPYVREWYERLGVAGERILPVGSPRFDRCIIERDEALIQGKQLLQEAGLDPGQPVLLVAVPDVRTDSYVLADLFRVVRIAQKRVPGLQVVFKFRSERRPPELSDFVHETFSSSAVCMGTEDLFSLLCASDAVVCGNSTVLYEAMLAHIPLLLYPWRASDTYHAEMYAPAAPILYSAQDLADAVTKVFSDTGYCIELVARQKRFLERYSFDGHSSERLAALLSASLSPSQ